MIRSKGFTLVELLVVIAILSLLLTLLIPGLEKARETTRRAYCLGQLKGLSTSLRMYGEDNEARWIPYNSLGYDARGSWNIRLRVAMYGGSEYKGRSLSTGYTKEQYEAESGQFLCPGDPAYLNASPRWSYWGTWGTLDAYTSYAINEGSCGSFWQPGNDNGCRYGPKFDEITAPFNVVLLMDSGPRKFAPLFDVLSFTSVIGDSIVDRNVWHAAYPEDNHGGLANTAYMDGHVASVSFEDVDYDPQDVDKVVRWYGYERPEWMWWMPTEWDKVRGR